ncbi:MAG: hypothetical protein PHP30_08250 [Bacteroidales bacterium]|nr:hypothetical protein [Bacteroidales bacterium]MDD2424814.1 hypothetical protein [Bacteroidales bacterium]MDD3990068.1 hypothetical protein [Bacteroidales bacterium]MDD4639675.1 hypothetical protein [Bacteroidales bacterium]
MKRAKTIFAIMQLLLLILSLSVATAGMEKERIELPVKAELPGAYYFYAPDFLNGVFQQQEQHSLNFNPQPSSLTSNPCNIGINNKVLSNSEPRERFMKNNRLLSQIYIRTIKNNSRKIGHDYLVYALREIIV